jgi:protein-L-isoaspartate O-methyltransferase
MNGRLVVPVGSQETAQVLERWTRVAPGSGKDAFLKERLLDVRFVPFLGDGAGKERKK